jgi:flagellar hook-associated protein 3 FlgL
MTEQITTQMQANTMLANLNSDLTQLDKTQNEMSTGLSIQQPSDNPYGTALSMQLNTQISAMNSYTSNINDGTAWANTASASLQSIQQMVERVRELVVEGANGTNSQSDLDDDADEVGSLIDGIKQDADTQYNGQYIFSGTATTTEPYQSGTNDAYQGDTGAISRAIGPGTTLQVNANLSSVLGSGTAANDGGLLDTLRTVVSDLQSGNSTALSSDLSSLDTNITSLESVQADVGAAQDRLSMASSRITSLQTTDQTELANVQDVDLGQASINFSTEQAGYQAALQSTADIVQTSLLNFLQN